MRATTFRVQSVTLAFANTLRMANSLDVYYMCVIKQPGEREMHSSYIFMAENESESRRTRAAPPASQLQYMQLAGRPSNGRERMKDEASFYSAYCDLRT